METLSPSPRPSSADESATLLAALESDLYWNLYTRPGESARPVTMESNTGRDFISALSLANKGSGTWDPGWLIGAQDEDGNIAVSKDGITYWVPPIGIRARNSEIVEGEQANVWLLKEYRYLVPGFYVALGSQEQNEIGKEPTPLLRLYWHVTSHTAARFVTAATESLIESNIPFKAKVLGDPGGYFRADAATIYINRRDFQRSRTALRRIHQSIRTGLRKDVPLFTKRLADGVGLAEDPANGLSFGLHRCKLVANALWRAFSQGGRHREAREEAIVSLLRESGLDPSRPYLGPGSTDCYDVDWLAAPDGRALAVDSPSLPAGMVTERERADRGTAATSPLAVATGIGDVICRAAFWSRNGSTCNWVGRSVDEMRHPGGTIAPKVVALGPDLYSGTTGIALFLARLHDHTGHPEHRRTALGAIAHSIATFERSTVDPFSSVSFYCGPLGAAFAAHYMGKAFGCEEVCGQATGPFHSHFGVDRISSDFSGWHT